MTYPLQIAGLYQPHHPADSPPNDTISLVDSLAALYCPHNLTDSLPDHYISLVDIFTPSYC